MNTLARNIIFSVLLAVITQACASQPTNQAVTSNVTSLVEQAQELERQEQFQEAYTILKPLADSGNPDANHKIAMLYRNENKKNPYFDIDKALDAYYQAANAGHAWAQIGLGQLLHNQVGKKYLEYKFDDIGHPELKELAEKNYKEGCTWFEKAARQGESFAMLDTARCYQNGYVTGEKDYVTAYAWFALAAGRFKVEENDPYAPNSMAETFMQRTAKRGKFTNLHIQKALSLANQLNKEIKGGNQTKN